MLAKALSEACRHAPLVLHANGIVFLLFCIEANHRTPHDPQVISRKSVRDGRGGVVERFVIPAPEPSNSASTCLGAPSTLSSFFAKFFRDTAEGALLVTGESLCGRRCPDGVFHLRCGPSRPLPFPGSSFLAGGALSRTSAAAAPATEGLPVHFDLGKGSSLLLSVFR